jgi:phage FluMu protein gp41
MSKTETIELTTPVKIGDEECRQVILREASAGDVIEAQEEAEKLIMTPDGPQLIASPSLVGLGVLRRQVVKIGDKVDGPVDVATLKRFSVFDLNALQDAADTMDAALDAEVAKAKMDKRGRTGEQES